VYEEAICSSSNVVVCADWNDGRKDGWALCLQPTGLKADVGVNGSVGMEHKIIAGEHGTLYYDKRFNSTAGPVHARHYVKFSNGYQFMYGGGYQKMLYLSRQDNGVSEWRGVMLGVGPAHQLLDGAYKDLPRTVGVFGFDYVGHHIRVANKPGDNPVLIYGDRWYCVEMMVDWRGQGDNTIKVWVDGVLQMERNDYTEAYTGDSSWHPGELINHVKGDAHYGGQGKIYEPPQDQYVWKDNYVVSRSYIGPIPGVSGGGTNAPMNLRVRGAGQ
jgi:hypothetical protein